MAQNLPPPCYQIYAASTLADRAFRNADLAVRGLIFTMELECWVNHRLPNSATELAKWLGFDAREIAAALPKAMPYFDVDSEGIYSPRLEKYRVHLNEIRKKQRKGGKKGADMTNEMKQRTKTPSATETESSLTNPRVHPRVDPQVEVRVPSTSKPSKANQSQKQSPGGVEGFVDNSNGNDEWGTEYEKTEGCTPDAYLKASGGE
jgi:hypothetical protein